MYSNWKWNINGEIQEKTKRIYKKKIIEEKTQLIEENKQIIEDNLPPQAEYSRIKSLKTTDNSVTPQEELYNRINNRAQIVQIGQNPFHKSSYIEDIEIQDKFLRGKK